MSDADVRKAKRQEWRWTNCWHDHSHMGNGSRLPHRDDGAPVHFRGDGCCQAAEHKATRLGDPSWFERVVLRYAKEEFGDR